MASAPTSPLSLRTAFAFPLQSALARREILIGAALLLIPGHSWLLNMGHRIRFVHNMQHGRPTWPAWSNPGTTTPDLASPDSLIAHGLVTFVGMVIYHAPASILIAVAHLTSTPALYPVAALLWVAASCIVPGYMTAYCVRFDRREVFRPPPLRRRHQTRRPRRPCILARLVHRPLRPRLLVPGTAGLRPRLPRHLRLVLAGRRLRLRDHVLADAGFVDAPEKTASPEVAAA